MRIKKSDNVLVVAGKDRGKTGPILRAIPEKDAVIVTGLNMRKRHVRARKSGQKGETIQYPAPMNVSNVMLICAKCGKTTRTQFKIEGDKKSRICKKCGSDI